MDTELLSYFRRISDEEQEILSGSKAICQERYTTKKQFIIDSSKMLANGTLIDVRPHTRFIHFPKHKHNYVEIIYMCQGTTTHIINGHQCIELQQGELLFLNQNVTQEILPATKNDIAINFIVLPEFFNRAFTMLEGENLLRDFLISTLQKESSAISYLHFQVKDILPIQNLIENLIWSIVTKEPNTQSIRQTTMGLLLMNLVNYMECLKPDSEVNQTQAVLVAAMRYIESNYPTATLQDFAMRQNLPTYQISRLLKKHTEHTFKELLQIQRLRQATFLLTNTNMSLENIISSIGYNNTSFFYHLFHDTYQMTPHEYRTSMAEKRH